MSYENLLLEVRDGVALVTMNRPKALNALNTRTIAELDACLAAVAQDASVHALVVTGAGEKGSQIPTAIIARLVSVRGQLARL